MSYGIVDFKFIKKVQDTEERLKELQKKMWEMLDG